MLIKKFKDINYQIVTVNLRSTHFGPNSNVFWRFPRPMNTSCLVRPNGKKIPSKKKSIEGYFFKLWEIKGRSVWQLIFIFPTFLWDPNLSLGQVHGGQRETHLKKDIFNGLREREKDAFSQLYVIFFFL